MWPMIVRLSRRSALTSRFVRPWRGFRHEIGNKKGERSGTGAWPLAESGAAMVISAGNRFAIVGTTPIAHKEQSD